mmetsp:Transcript_22587/g.55186  ORF Transcript_22587/g.55186 Transcript_22587/m.55186 type:complete len:246 (+) Transcript_22587:166-903(+)
MAVRERSTATLLSIGVIVTLVAPRLAHAWYSDPYAEVGTACSQVCSVNEGSFISGSTSCLNYGHNSTCGKYLALYRNCDYVCQDSGSSFDTCHKYPDDQQTVSIGGNDDLQFTLRKCQNAGTLAFSSVDVNFEMTCSLAYCTMVNPFTTSPEPTCDLSGKVTTCSDYLWRKHGCYSDVDVCAPGYACTAICIAAYSNKYCSNFSPVWTTCNNVPNFDHTPYLDFCDDCNRPPDATRPSAPTCPAV